jgi:hypothetical protein
MSLWDTLLNVSVCLSGTILQQMSCMFHKSTNTMLQTWITLLWTWLS